MYDLIIIGAGPAGLTAAIYACRANKKTLVLEAVTYGGQIVNTHKIENYLVQILLRNYMNRLRKLVLNLFLSA